MSKNKFAIMYILLITLMLIACSNNSKSEYVNEDLSVYKEYVLDNGITSLEDELTNTDIYWDSLKTIDSDVLRGLAYKLILSNEEEVLIYEYSDAELMLEDVESISDDGYTISLIDDDSITSTHYSWANKPYFFRFKNLIILYTGIQTDTINLLKEMSVNLINSRD